MTTADPEHPYPGSPRDFTEGLEMLAPERLIKCFNDYDHAIQNCRTTLNLRTGPGSPLSKKEQAYLAESTLIISTAYWDGFVENLMLTCVYQERYPKDPADTSAPSPEEIDECKAKAMNGGFLQCGNTSALIDSSEKCLSVERNPFLKLSDYHQKILDIYKFRNYLVHYGINSYKDLGTLYKSRYKREWTRPGYFLLEENAKQLNEFIDTFEAAAQKMKKEVLKTATSTA